MIFSEPRAFAAAQQADLLTQAGVLDTPKLARRLMNDVLLPNHTVVDATDDSINASAGAILEVTAAAYRNVNGWDEVECRRSVSRLLTKQGLVQYLLDGSGHRLCFATIQRAFTSPTMGTIARRYPGVFVTNNNTLKMDNLLRPYIEQFTRQAAKRGDLLRLEVETNPALAAEIATMCHEVAVEFERNLVRGLNSANPTNNPGLPSGA